MFATDAALPLLFCPWRSSERLTSQTPCVIPAQALSSAAVFSPPAAPWPPNNHTLLFLFTICHRWKEKWRKKACRRKRGAGAGIDRLPQVLKPDIDFLSFFSNGKKCIVRLKEISMGIWGKRSWNEHPVHCCLLWIVYRAVVIELSEQGPSPICALWRVFPLSMYLCNISATADSGKPRKVFKQVGPTLKKHWFLRALLLEILWKLPACYLSSYTANPSFQTGICPVFFFKGLMEWFEHWLWFSLNMLHIQVCEQPNIIVTYCIYTSEKITTVCHENKIAPFISHTPSLTSLDDFKLHLCSNIRYIDICICCGNQQSGRKY